MAGCKKEGKVTTSETLWAEGNAMHWKRQIAPNPVDAPRPFADGFAMLARFCLRLAAAACLVAAMAASAEGPFSFESTPGKLPKNIVPRHYEIRLQPDLEKFTTRGTVTVDLEVLKPADEIVFNALDLTVTKATLIARKETELKPKADLERQTVTLKLPSELPRGNCRLALEFEGQMGEEAQGLFYVKYATPSGKKIMVGTQMEPTDARRMFPCWDEPSFRATVDLTVVVPEKHLAVSNMPIERERPLGNGLKEVKFGRTPPMASYLVVLVSGELEELKGRAEGVQIRVITTEGKKEQGRYALEATKKLLAYYNNYFGIKYPLPKLDQIAIPGGFSGAMENWGGITYNESMLLVRSGNQFAADAAGHFHDGGARNVAPMVREPGDDGVVGQPVAQRRIRHVDGNEGDRPFQPGVAVVAGRERGQNRRDERRRAQHDASHPDTGGKRKPGE